MADITQISVGDAKPGRYVIVDGAACVVKSVDISKPGKHGSTKARIEAVGVIDGKKRVIIKPTHDNLESPVIGKESAQVLSLSGDTANVMDMKSYETFDLKIPEELKDQVKEGSQVVYWIVLNDKVMKQVKSE